ncbi:CdiA C-terminal domain-containing protein [Anthocerotibacter panamensis]|uniref:CdiA C-terminal domain-containing protein n=1 Tax=Anthocerotibacter panamensis TaxID=2857077 RepID=UPI001C402078|nr:TIG domain-containing protein [Anthocerotibacter panamensis]
MQGLKSRADKATGYNLEVAGDHTYFVGDSADWVQSSTPIPGRTTYSFNPPNVFPSQQQSSTLTIRTDASTPPNTYNLTIGGTTINGPSGVRSMSTSLTVTPATTPPNTPTITSVSSFSAQVGQTVTLTGNNLGNATQVWFGGVPAAFTANVSTNQVTAAVPPNAPTAPISVVTANGTTQTAQNFVPTNVPTAPRQAQFDLGIAAQQILQFYENNQRTFDALGQIAQGLFYEGLGSVGGAAGGAGFSLSLTADATGVGLPIGIAAGVASAGLIAASAGSIIYGQALVNQGVKGLFEQYYAAGTGQGSLNVIGKGFSDSERRVAQQLADQGNEVILREATGTERLSDLLVNGVPYDVYTPTTGNVNRIVSAVASKGSQVRGGGVIIDLSKSPLTPEALGNILQRVQGITSQISNILVIP